MCQELIPGVPLTPRQNQIRFAARNFKARTGRWPTERALGEALGIGRTGYLKRVVRKLRALGEWPR
jgi:hypothetical protein